MLIAEDLLLLLTDDETGKITTDRNRLDFALAGACLVELALLGRVDVAGKGEAVKKGRLIVRDETPVDDALLNEVLRTCVDRTGSAPSTVLSKTRKDVRPQLLDRLADAGILRREDGRVLGFFPTTRWPAEDSSHERQLRGQLDAVLNQGAEPDERTAALTGLLSAVDAAHKVVNAIDRRAVRKRAKEIREGHWAAGAVNDAVRAVESAVNAAVIAAVAGAAAGAAGSS